MRLLFRKILNGGFGVYNIDFFWKRGASIVFFHFCFDFFLTDLIFSIFRIYFPSLFDYYFVIFCTLWYARKR